MKPSATADSVHKVIQFTDANFAQGVLQSKVPVLVDFWAPWCAPCRNLSPIIEDLAAEYQDRVKAGKLNVDENPDAAARYGIRSIPAVLLFKDGEIVERFIGLQSRERYEQALAQITA